MTDYVEIAKQSLGRWQTRPEPESGNDGITNTAAPLEEISELPQALRCNSEDTRREVWLSWAEWKAQSLNRLFQEQGLTGQPGRITVETVRHSERYW